MATQTSATGIAPIAVKKTAAGERRRETRFGTEGEISIVLMDDPQAREVSAQLMDFSLRGLRLRVANEIPQGRQVRVFFAWGEVATQVMWTSAVPEEQAFDIGLQLF